MKLDRKDTFVTISILNSQCVGIQRHFAFRHMTSVEFRDRWSLKRLLLPLFANIRL